MAPAKTFTGARAQLLKVDPNTGAAVVMGIFNNVSVGMTYTADPIYLLGRYSPDEIVYTAQDAVHVTATGWRVVGADPQTVSGMPALATLMSADYVELAILDRETNERIASIHSVRPLAYSMSVANRQTVEITVTFMGLLIDTENVVNAEAPNASTLPPTT